MTERIGPRAWTDHYVHPCAWRQDFAPLAMTDMFVASAEKYGARTLADFYGRIWSYAQILAEARAFASGLQARGVGKGDRIGLFLPNVPLYLSAYFGIMLAGATVVNFSPLYSPEELEAQVADSGARLMVTLDVPALLPTALTVLDNSALEGVIVGRLSRLLPFWKGLGLRVFGRSQYCRIKPDPRVTVWDDALRTTLPDPVPIDPLTDLALLQYTGGTTGTPKGAMLTHQNLSANARQINLVDPHRHDRDVIIGVLPFFHVFANACVLNRTVCNGGTIAMLPRFEAHKTLETIARVRATSMPGVPTMYQALLDDAAIDGTDFSTLDTCISGGAPLPGPVRDRFEAHTGARLIEGYGLTECSGVASTNPYRDGARIGTIGHPIPGTDMRLLDKEDASRDAPEGEPGELAISGPQVMLGYWNRPDAAATAFVERDGTRWLRTGDIAVIDPDGHVRIVDRSKDMIAVGGFKVFPSQVEAVLLENPAVREVLVLGMPDAYHGEVPRAYVTLDPEAAAGTDTDPEALRAWANARLGKHERVDAVVVRSALPRTMVGKLDRKTLRREVMAEAG